MKINGSDELFRRLREKKGAAEKGAEVGLKKAGLFLQRQSQKIVPIDTGNLKASAFTRITGSGFRARVLVGYTASYAIFVHEMVENRHAPGKYAKFLETPFYGFQEEMLEIVEKEIRKALKGK